MKLIEMTRDENFCNLKSSHFCCSIQMHRSTFHFLFQRSVAFVNNLIHNEFLTLKLYWHFILQLKMLFSLFQGNKTEMLIPNVQPHSWYDVCESVVLPSIAETHWCICPARTPSSGSHMELLWPGGSSMGAAQVQLQPWLWCWGVDGGVVTMILWLPSSSKAVKSDSD